MGIKNTLKGFLNVTAWVGLDQIKKDSLKLKNLSEEVLAQPKSENRNETFEMCMQRLGVSEAQLKKRMRVSFNVALFCFGVGLAVIIYAFYLFALDKSMAGVTTFILGILLWSNAFREHFNYFQMKKRRLGCTLADWLLFIVRGK